MFVHNRLYLQSDQTENLYGQNENFNKYFYNLFAVPNLRHR